MKVQYQVRAVVRYVVTRWEESEDGRSGGSTQCGEYGNNQIAYEVGYALCKAEHDRLGYPAADERIQYPKPIMSNSSLDSSDVYHVRGNELFEAKA